MRILHPSKSLNLPTVLEASVGLLRKRKYPNKTTSHSPSPPMDAIRISCMSLRTQRPQNTTRLGTTNPSPYVCLQTTFQTQCQRCHTFFIFFQFEPYWIELVPARAPGGIRSFCKLVCLTSLMRICGREAHAFGISRSGFGTPHLSFADHPQCDVG